ncbi:methylmalonyl Co-A mutase-associated GTPase MeaB [Deinococcus aquiradiocola]|uniref:LAO/AO transport system kinase n=1 Tax=Deinococcus aquiradiocola TaxID=393059 RepID=A0A917PCJ7_9DEIO|nr:methylmalonyl Co-A mutase-associated GTPase MeaB [Deinococcus aquiradiocola]GGJ71009.1 LAO/AO transport system kinase [Deinococcus aquiradiocola]
MTRDGDTPAVPDRAASLLARYAAGDVRALSRGITLAESGGPDAQAFLQGVRARTHAHPRPVVIGLTGSPGSGKSTLASALVTALRARGVTVGVLAVDPSSPFSGGAILGDRIRMLAHHADPGVFVRSLASRGALGGLSARSMQVLSVMEGFGFGVLLLETVGVGQSELDIAALADHTVLVLTPAGGDGVQAFKAGIMEVADILVVNKADLPGADRLARELRAAQLLGPHDEHTFFPPVVQTVASTASGLDALLDAVDAHRAHLGEAGLRGQRLERARFEVRSVIQAHALALARGAGAGLLERVASGDLSADDVARTLLAGRVTP